MMAAISNPYSDIIHLPHHKSPKRKEMSLYDRAAQFSPFAALTGFDGVIAETGRTTAARRSLSEYEMDILSHKLMCIDEAVQNRQHPIVSVVFFAADEKKDGGAYLEYTGQARSIDSIERTIIFFDDNGRSAGKSIAFDDIMDIRGDMFSYQLEG